MFKYYKYDVTVSFAEEERPFVDRVVADLIKKKIKVFYDDNERITSWGKDLNPYLDKVYRKQAKFCVIFVSENYKRKRWTKYERERAQARAYFEERQEYILPFRLDSAELEGLTDTIAYLSIETHNEQQLVNAICKKIERDRSGLSIFLRWFNEFFTQKVRLATIVVAAIGFAFFSLADRLTPIDALAQRLHERNKRHFHGAICRDGSLSHSHGPGTCSYHGGVQQYVDTFVYGKTIDQCREEAQKTSWLLD